MYRIVICEDDDLQRHNLKNYISKTLSEISSELKIYTFNSGEELLKSDLENIDIYFLDIQMNELTGMDVAKIIRSTNDNCEIIFITSHIGYIQEGYKVRAYRYLLKPIFYEDLRKNLFSCITDVIKRKDNFLVIENKGSIENIDIKDITYIEVIKSNIIIHTKNKSYNTKGRMKTLEKDLLMHDFFRCHKSYLINMKHIQFIKKDIVNINNEEIPVSKHRISDLKTKLTKVLASVVC